MLIGMVYVPIALPPEIVKSGRAIGHERFCVVLAIESAPVEPPNTVPAGVADHVTKPLPSAVRVAPDSMLPCQPKVSSSETMPDGSKPAESLQNAFDPCEPGIMTSSAAVESSGDLLTMTWAVVTFANPAATSGRP